MQRPFCLKSMGVMEKVHPSSTFRNQACQPGGDATRWGFLSAARKEPKTTKGGAFPRLVESTPRYWVEGATFLFSALGPARSHRWHGYSTECSCFSGRQHFYCQGLTLVCNCSQLPEAWLPAAGTPLLQGRPGCENHSAIGPAAQGGLVWWQYQEPQQG